MGYKQQTRFVIDAGGAPREILKVLERSNGDLIIMPRHAPNHDGRSGSKRIRHEHISAHGSPNSVENGTTIAHTFALADGMDVRSSAFIHQSKADLRWFAKLSLSPRLDTNHYRFVADRRDMIVNIGQYEPRFQTLFFGIMISRRGVTLPDHDEPANIHKAEFREFTVGLYSYFMLAPSLPTGEDVYVGTRMPTVDGVRAGDDSDRKQARSLRPGDVLPFLSDAFWLCRDRYLMRYVTAGARQETIASLARSTEIISSFPVLTLEDFQYYHHETQPTLRIPHSGLDTEYAEWKF